MKKTRLLASVLSLALAGTLCFGIAACGDDGGDKGFGKVSSAQWEAAFAASNFTNMKSVNMITEKESGVVTNKVTYVVAGDRQYNAVIDGDESHERYAVKVGDAYTYYYKDSSDGWSKDELTYEQGFADIIIMTYTAYGAAYAGFTYDSAQQGYVMSVTGTTTSLVVRFKNGKLAEIYSEMDTYGDSITVTMASTTTFTFGGQSIILPDESGFDEDQFDKEEEGGNGKEDAVFTYVGTWQVSHFLVGGREYGIGSTLPADIAADGATEVTADYMVMTLNKDYSVSVTAGFANGMTFTGKWQEVEGGVFVALDTGSQTFLRKGDYLYSVMDEDSDTMIFLSKA